MEILKWNNKDEAIVASIDKNLVSLKSIGWIKDDDIIKIKAIITNAVLLKLTLQKLEKCMERE